MTASPDALPHREFAASPLLHLAAWAQWLALAGLALAALAVAVGGFGPAIATLALGSVAATLIVTALFATLAERHIRRRTTHHAHSLAAGLGDDPDPVLVTDAKGGTCAANRAAAAETRLGERLSGWSADPAQAVRDMLAECLERGRSSRDYHRNCEGLRVTAHIAQAAGGLVVWRFVAHEIDRRPDGGASALPVISRVERMPRANGAARALLELGDGAESGLQAITRALEDAVDAVAARPFEIATARLPDGRNLRVMAVPGGGSHPDLVLLPEQALPALDLARDDAVSNGFEDIPVALVTLDADGKVITTNRLARALLGLEDGATPHFWEVIEGLGRPVSDWLDDARAGRALGRPEVLRATRTSEETFVQIILRRATVDCGQGALVAVISDATELKSLEARFVQSQKMQAIGQLAGGVAHDFNNLLTAISGHCDLLLMNRDRYDPDYNDLLQIHQNANRAAALVRQLLAFSRKQTLKPETFRLESLLEDLIHLLTRLVGERITLDLAHDPDLRPIRADRRQLEQVIMNLVVNARDAMPMGGSIRIETRALQLESELEHGRARVPPGDYVTIRVIDEGVGIAPGIIDKVFEPFFTTKRMGEGTGLGLSTAYGIVKQMGGYIFADSVEGSGTTFTLYFASQPESAVRATAAMPPARALPDQSADPAIVPDAAIPSPARPQPTSPRRASLPDPASAAGSEVPGTPSDPGNAATPHVERPPLAAPNASGEASGAILLVEDEAPVRAFAARALRLQGYRVFEAQDGEQALEFLADPTLQVDLFVTDVIMPGVDGPGWVSEALVDRPGTPVVFMSGYTEDTLSAALSRIPRSVFMGKPFSLKDLNETILRQLALEAAR